MSLQSLVGKTISKIYVSEDKDYIAFESKESEELHCFVAQGECCSESWISGVFSDKGSFPFPMKVLSVREHVYKEEKGEDDEGLIKTYMIDLVGDDGEKITVFFKNSSNGYYGGTIEKYEDGLFDKMNAHVVDNQKNSISLHS